MEFSLLLFFFSLFAIEQVVMVKLGSYPYHWGFPIARNELPENLLIKDYCGLLGRVRMKKDQKGNVFMRYKHFPISWGPYVFVGQVKNEKPTELIVRLGPLTGLFFASFIILGLLQGLSETIVALITSTFFIAFFFHSFQKGYKKIINKINTI